MSKREVEQLFSPYFRTYFASCFSHPSWSNSYIRFVDHILEVTDAKGKLCLDAGCGFGLLSIFLSGLGAKHVIGLDVNGEKVSIARKLLGMLDPKPMALDIVKGDALNMPFSDESFDVIVVN
ncbi:MAG: class I SAM-dependent methyltransferase [Fervidobacterium sp.]